MFIMTTFTERIIEGKMALLNDELETSLRMTGQTFESIKLGLGDTSLQREVLPDGSKGSITVSTQEFDDLFGSFVTYQNYVLAKVGDLVPDTQFGERSVGKIRKAAVLAKIAFGRVNHWDIESDFDGTDAGHEED